MIRNILLNQNKKYLIAVSGGPDSMCLLNLCKKNIALVCHVNYNKRASAMRDENIVKQYCKKNRIKLKILNVTKIIYDQYKKNNFEHIAREIRYDFFYKCAKAINNFNILIAHNLDDFVETAIMQEEKKSKSLFYGIKQISFHHGLNIYHPLINYRKKELKKYCIEHDIIFGIDETNFSDLFYRNRIRKENAKLPAKKFNELISKFNKYNQNNRILYQQVNKYYLKWRQKQYLDTYFLSLNKKYWYHLVYILLSENNIASISSNKINGIIQFIVNGKNNKSYRIGNETFLTKK